MGVSGSGKSLVGNHLAQRLPEISDLAFELDFVDGDDLHPKENVELMRAGIKLNDNTRQPWLDAICQYAESHFSKDRSLVVACSALKKKYRQQLRTVSGPVFFVFLNGPMEVIQKRIQARQGHYMPSSLLESQFADLEDPAGEPGLVCIDVNQSKDEVLAQAVEKVSELIEQR